MRCLFLIGLVSAISSSSGQTPPRVAPPPQGSEASSIEAPGVALSERQFLDSLTAEHPAMELLNQRTETVRSEALEATIRSNPSLGLVREDLEGPARQTDLTVRWRPIERGRGDAVDSGAARVEAAQHDQDADTLALRIEMKRVFADWAFATARAAGDQRQVELLRRLVEREEARARSGETSQLLARRLRLAQGGMEKRRALMLAKSATTRAEAATWWPLLPAGATPNLPHLPSPEEVAQALRAGGAHPRLSSALAQTQAAQLTAESLRHRLDYPELIAGWQEQRVGTQSVDGVIIGLNWSLPVFDRNQARQSRAAAAQEAARSRLQLLERELDSERAGALAAYEQLHRAVQQARALASGNALLVEGAQTSFQLGESGLTDLLDTLSSTNDAEIAVLDLHQEALAALRHLERLLGRPLLTPSSLDPKHSEARNRYASPRRFP